MKCYFKSFCIIFCVLLLSCYGSVATFNGGSVTEKELENNLQQKLHQIKLKEYEEKVKLARHLAIEKILKQEEHRQNKTSEQLIDNYTNKNYQSKVKEFYDYNKDSLKLTFEEARPQIENDYGNQIRDFLKSEYYAQLQNEYKLIINLTKPIPPTANISTKEEPFWGNPKSKVEIVEYSDYDCPYCQRLQTVIKKIQKEYDKKIKWVFKDFPLKSIHPKAMKAHIASNCANEQNKFTKYHFRLFELAAGDLTEEVLLDIAKETQLNIPKFKVCLQDKKQKLSKEIDNDIEEGVQNGVGGTPTIFLNGVIQDNFHTYQAMKKIIEDALK